jgi:hypothetical protein
MGSVFMVLPFAEIDKKSLAEILYTRSDLEPKTNLQRDASRAP